MSTKPKKVPWFAWPFVLVWNFLALMVGLTGRLLAIILGIVLLIVGVIVSFTFIGAIIGIPLAIVGFLLVIRGLF
jgi:hypothetical protein